jgi:aminomethyltransferase
MLPGTPFHPRTQPLNAAQVWRRWSGYLTAGAYELSHEREYWAVRNSAALFDVSPLLKYHIHGPDAARLLNRVVTRDVERLRVGQVLYTPWCDAAGKVIDDGTVARLDVQRYRLTAAEPNLRWLSLNAVGMDVTIEDVSREVGALALQGPKSRMILNACAEAPLDDLKYFGVTHARLGGVPVTVSRTGYTGDLGYELWCDARDSVAVWDTLLQVGGAYGITPAGILALDVARVEAGLILLDVDYTSAHVATIPEQTSSPYELNLGWAVDLRKERFVGRAALAAEQARGPAWQLVGLEIEWPTLERLFREAGLPPQIPSTTVRASVPLSSLGRQIGYATSSCWSPLLKKYIALAHVEAAHATPGSLLMFELMVQHQRRYTPARVVPLPFFNPERKRGA